MHWKEFYALEDLENIIKTSFHQPVLIYKHSTRCSLSSIVRSRLESSWEADPLDIVCYFLDLISFKEVSNAVEDQFQIRHQSPQILMIHQGKCIFHCSHLSIGHSAIKEALPQFSVPKVTSHKLSGLFLC